MPLSILSSSVFPKQPSVIVQRLNTTKILLRLNNSNIVTRYKSTVSKTTTTTPSSTKIKKNLFYTFMTKDRPVIGCVGDLCGNASSLLTVWAYLNTEMLLLRSLAISSGVLGMSFQYFRPQPLWIPIRWNLLLMGINCYMVTELLMERHRANNMPADRIALYEDGEFDERGFSKIQFGKFLDQSNRRVFHNEMITQENREMNKLYFIINGDATVTCSKDGRKLATIPQHHFIGEMAFLIFYQSQNKEDDDAPFANASANVMANGFVHVYEWDARELARIMKEDRDLQNAFASYCSHDLRKKLLTANAEGGSTVSIAAKKS